VALARKYPDAKISDIVKVSFNELTGATGLELKEPVDKEVDETEIKANMDV